MAKKNKTSDISITNQGSVMLFTLNTQNAHDWVEQNVQLEGWQWLGKNAFAVDTRFAENLSNGMQGVSSGNGNESPIGNPAN